MNDILEFEWDESKSHQRLRERGFWFAFAVPAFADPDVVAPFGLFPHARPTLAIGDVMTRARLKDDGTVVEILRDGAERPLAPQVDGARIDATTAEEITAQIAQDDAEAMRDAAAYARRVRRKVGLSQVAFARRIGVPVDTVRNWEQGRRAPQGPARALLRIIDRAPKTGLRALNQA
jgi:putative transcriptional regulator